MITFPNIKINLGLSITEKRPDGYHEASPADYLVVEVSPNIKIWLHKKDHKNFPFRVSGGWQDEDATERLNLLVNLLQKPLKDWISSLTELFHNSTADSPQSFLVRELQWLDELCKHFKGDTWELEIMDETLQEVRKKMQRAVESFPAE